MGFDHSRGNIFYLGGAGGGATVGDFRHNPNIKQLKLESYVNKYILIYIKYFIYLCFYDFSLVYLIFLLFKGIYLI